MVKKERIGEGTYSIVYSAYSEDQNYAVKRNLVESELNFFASLREMDILNKLKRHPYIITLEFVTREPFPLSPRRFPNNLIDDQMHFVFPLADSDLTYIYDIDDMRVLTRYMVDILLALEYMHSKDIIHRDIKPQNILIIEGEIKICDFGLSKPFSYQGPNSPRVVTSWYRAPELILENEYNFSVDIWSLGCVFFEMIAKRPFISNVRDNNRELMRKIKASLPKDDCDFHGESWFDQLFRIQEEGDNSFMRDRGEFIDLLSNMINYYPEKRYTATQCLNHVFFQPYIKHINEIRRSYPPVPDELHSLRVINCPEREWSFDIAAEVFNRRNEYPGYDHRIIFQSIDLFDRYLLYLDSSKNRNREDKNNGYFLTKYEARLTFLVTLYISMKYFTGMVTPVPFQNIVGSVYKNKEAYDKAHLIESYLIKKVFENSIYRPTLYDIIKVKLKIGDIKDLLLIVKNVHEFDPEMKIDELARIFLESKGKI